jgi:hypothetical protein
MSFSNPTPTKRDQARNDRIDGGDKCQWKSINLTISFPLFSRQSISPSICMSYFPNARPCNPEAPPPKHNPGPSLFREYQDTNKAGNIIAEHLCQTKHQKRVQLREEKKTDPAQSKIPKALKVSLACKSDACLLEKSYKQRGKPVCFLLFSVTSIIRPLDIVSERRAFVSWCSDKLAGQHLSQRARPIIHCFAKSCESCCGEAK